ncbi:hypothetical protein PO124_19925 [Bacillus licheniformis]|nr:hypothetical protein [Bacillus licheniformis]
MSRSPSKSPPSIYGHRPQHRRRNHRSCHRGEESETIMFGMEPYEIATLLNERSAMLESTKKGFSPLIEQENQARQCGSEAPVSKMGIEENPIDRDVLDILPNSRLKQVIETQKPVQDRDVRINGLELVFNEVPIHLKRETSSERLRHSATNRSEALS